jgi:hypothetical protein
MMTKLRKIHINADNMNEVMHQAAKLPDLHDDLEIITFNPAPPLAVKHGDKVLFYIETDRSERVKQPRHTPRKLTVLEKTKEWFDFVYYKIWYKLHPSAYERQYQGPSCFDRPEDEEPSGCIKATLEEISRGPRPNKFIGDTNDR